MLKVRSVVAFRPSLGLMPSFLSFVVLRVLDLTSCKIGEHGHLNLQELGSLLHLRYLGLADTGITEVPEEVGKLQFLQVLDLGGNYKIEELPSAVIKLRRLMCLLIHHFCKKLPDGLGDLTSMEVLSQIHGDSLSTVKELGNMKRLWELEIWFDNLSLELEEAFVESLGKLSNIQSLQISFRDDSTSTTDILGERWVPPPSLQEFVIKGDIKVIKFIKFIKFSTLPAWIRRNPLHLSKLSVLQIGVDQVRQEYLEILGRLPALCRLGLWSSRQSGPLLVGADGFCCLTSFEGNFLDETVFQAGAMPKAERAGLIGARVANEEAVGNLGLGNLRSLRYVRLFLRDTEVTVRQAKQAEVALEKALRAHPNSPSFGIVFY